MFKGITKRWMLNTLSVILTIIILIVVSLIFIVTYLYQSSVEQSLSSTSGELSLVFSGSQATAQPLLLLQPATMLKILIRKNRWL